LHFLRSLQQNQKCRTKTILPILNALFYLSELKKDVTRRVAAIEKYAIREDANKQRVEIERGFITEAAVWLQSLAEEVQALVDRVEDLAEENAQLRRAQRVAEDQEYCHNCKPLVYAIKSYRHTLTAVYKIMVGEGRKTSNPEKLSNLLQHQRKLDNLIATDTLEKERYRKNLISYISRLDDEIAEEVNRTDDVQAAYSHIQTAYQLLKQQPC